MKVAVSAQGADLQAALDERFGRCPYFIIVDTESMAFEAIPNENVARGGGAGIQSAGLMADKKVQALLTGNCGPNAHQTLTAAGIQVVTGCTGSVLQAVEKFKAGECVSSKAANVSSHHGMGS